TTPPGGVSVRPRTLRALPGPCPLADSLPQCAGRHAADGTGGERGRRSGGCPGMKPGLDSPRRRTRRRPVVSVCIANSHCRYLLRGCLRSLTSRRQGVRLEVIVVDNASTDGSADVVEREFPRVSLIRNDVNAGYARACNQAAQVARGRYLFFL